MKRKRPSEGIRTARTQHVCFLCSQTIHPGEDYMWARWGPMHNPINDGFWTYEACEWCDRRFKPDPVDDYTYPESDEWKQSCTHMAECLMLQAGFKPDDFGVARLFDMLDDAASLAVENDRETYRVCQIFSTHNVEILPISQARLLKPYPDKVCQGCGIRHSQPWQRSAETCFHRGVCDVCGKDFLVAHPSEFGWPAFPAHQSLNSKPPGWPESRRTALDEVEVVLARMRGQYAPFVAHGGRALGGFSVENLEE